MSDSGQNGITLLHERLTRLEERGDNRDKKLDAIDEKVDALMRDMQDIKMAWKIGSGIGAKVAAWVPAGAIGAAVTWLATHLMPGK